jgi:putative membrane protein
VSAEDGGEAYRSLESDQLTLRDRLAIDRTKLANERTFLAYVRSAIMLFISGVTLVKLFADDAVVVQLGVALIPASVAIVLFGGVRFHHMKRRLAADVEGSAEP